MQNNLRAEEQKNVQNSISFWLQNPEFDALSNQERAELLTQKVMAIRNDFTSLQSMVHEQQGFLI